MLDASRIAAHLYIGAAPLDTQAVRKAGFDLLVLCAMEHQPPASSFSGVRVLHAPLDDACPSVEEWHIAMNASRVVADALRQGRRVLVTCWQGRNRSGLVAALALRRLKMPARTAVEVVRTHRRAALVNPHFVQAVLTGRRPC